MAKKRRSSLKANLAKSLRELSQKRKQAKESFPVSEMSRDQLLKAGKRPRSPGKTDHWALLTDSQRERILARSREHLSRQEKMGVPESMLYGPALVLEGKARWEDRLSTTSMGD